MSNCTQQSAGCQKGRPIKAGRLYIIQSQKQKTNRQGQGQSGQAIELFQITPHVTETVRETYGSVFYLYNPGSSQPLGASNN